MPEGVRSKNADGSAIARLASFLGKPSVTIVDDYPDESADRQFGDDRAVLPKPKHAVVRILQQTSVMLGHCRMRSSSKPQSHARSAVGSSGPDEPRGWAGEGRSSPARKSVPANRIDGGWLLDLKGPRRAFYTTKLPAFQNARSAVFFCTPVKTGPSAGANERPFVRRFRGFLFPPGAPLRRGGVKSWGTPPNPRGGRPHFPPATHVRSSRGCPVGPVNPYPTLVKCT